MELGALKMVHKDLEWRQAMSEISQPFETEAIVHTRYAIFFNAKLLFDAKVWTITETNRLQHWNWMQRGLDVRC